MRGLVTAANDPSELARRARIEQAERDLQSLAEATRRLNESRERGHFKRLAEFVSRPLPRARVR